MSSTLKVKKKMVTIVVNKKKMVSWSDYFRFDLVFIKKNNQINFFKNQTETGSNRLVSVHFLDKTGSNRFDLARF